MFNMIFSLALMLTVLALAAYAQYRTGFHTATPLQAAIARLTLVLVGIGFGWTTLLWAMQPAAWLNAVIFLTAFGLVHVPAAVVLYIKRQRGVYH
jgi:hypothetical protein